MLRALPWIVALAAVLAAACAGDINHERPNVEDTDNDITVDHLQLVFYDVGLGLATLVIAPGPFVALIDGGNVGDGVAVICPDLEARGIDHLDVMELTHPHGDHAGGLAEVFDCVDVGAVWTNGETSATDEGYLIFAAALAEWDGTVVVKREGDIDQLGDLAIGTLHGNIGADDSNNNSLVQVLAYDGFRVLLSADIEQSAQQTVVDNYAAQLAAPLVQIPDHGSAPFSAEFVSALTATVGILSVGANDPEYPADETVAAYQAAGLTIYRTDENGTIQVDVVDGEMQITTAE